MAKNRRTVITEMFEAFAKNDEFNYDLEQLWELFDSCVQKKLIKKLSKERDGKQIGSNTEVKTRGKTGYQHFLSEFSLPIPDGKKKREYKGSVWNSLSLEERGEWAQKAAEFNAENGIHKKPTIKTSVQENEQYEEKLLEWSNADPDTRGPMPSRPGSVTSSPDNSPPESPKDSLQDSDSDTDDIDITNKLKALQLDKQKRNIITHQSDSDSDSDTDTDSDSEQDPQPNDERIEWLKTIWAEEGWKKNVSANFKAWIMFSNHDTFGPDKDNNISPTQFGEFKKKHNYDSTSKAEDAPWYEFIIKNAII